MMVLPTSLTTVVSVWVLSGLGTTVLVMAPRARGCSLHMRELLLLTLLGELGEQLEKGE